jgi:DNA modification methylase
MPRSRRVIISTDEHGAAILTLEEYPDLLACRALAEWHFISEDPPEVATRVEHLAAAGLADESAAVRWAPQPDFLFDYQRWMVERALDRERFAIFADCGLGKTLMQLEWARQIMHATQGRVLIVAPLQVVHQTVDEAHHFYGEYPIVALDDSAMVPAWLSAPGPSVAITNYEKIEKLDGTISVAGVVLDESSVLKQTMGARRTALIRCFAGIRYKLCCTATPAPNDRVEYAEHAFFLDVVRSTREFLARFFVNLDGEWQLKHHGETAFYRHLASWSVFMRDPAAYRFADNLRDLAPMTAKFPAVPLTVEQAEAARGYEAGTQPSLFGATPGGIVSRTKVMQIAHGFLLDGKGKVTERYPTLKPTAIAELCNITHGDEQVIVWVTFDEEARQVAELIPDAAVISGKTPKPRRAVLIDEFRQGGGPRVLLAKPSMLGFGLNLQSCRIQVFSTITDSFERYYQAVRRSHRYGQTRPVIVYVPLTPLDDAMCQNVLSKEAVWREDGRRQEQAYVDVLRPRDDTERRVLVTTPQAELDRVEATEWTMIQGDSIAHMETMADQSVDFSIFSPPFANLFTYSSAAADMGNVRGDAEYRLQWRWFAERLLRVMRPGRNVAIHCMDIIRFASQHGVRHTYDYPSDLRAGMQDAGFLYRARVSIDKNPQAQATRTKDANLLFVTLTRDALDSHPQAGEYVLLFTAPGENETPVMAMDVSNAEWIEWAHHVWYGIRETDVLNAALGKEHQDERHICPLQLPLIERSVRLWSNRGEMIFSPFAGIGSEGYVALEWGRRFYGVELKRSYFDQACRFLDQKTNAVAGRMGFAS